MKAWHRIKAEESLTQFGRWKIKIKRKMFEYLRENHQHCNSSRKNVESEEEVLNFCGKKKRSESGRKLYIFFVLILTRLSCCVVLKGKFSLWSLNNDIKFSEAYKISSPRTENYSWVASQHQTKKFLIFRTVSNVLWKKPFTHVLFLKENSMQKVKSRWSPRSCPWQRHFIIVTLGCLM